MSLAPPSAFYSWTTADVCAWAKSTGLCHSIPGLAESLRRCSVAGPALVQLDNTFAQSKLQIREAAKRKLLLDAVVTLTRSQSPMVAGSAAGGPGTMTSSASPSGLSVPVFHQQSAATGGHPSAAVEYTASISSASGSSVSRSSSSVSGSLASADYRGKSPLPAGQASNMGSEPMMGIPARDLMSDGCSHCGWIRKLGGTVHNWKKRYMVLKKGCLYYYKDDLAALPKGQFSLNDYRVEKTQVSTKYDWCFKLVHTNPKKRTYVVSASSEPELQAWIEKIQNDIEVFCMGFGAVAPQAQGQSQPAALLSTSRPTIRHSGNSTTLMRALDPDDESSDEEGVYDKARSDATPYDKQTGPPPAPPSRKTSVRKLPSDDSPAKGVTRSKTSRPFQPSGPTASTSSSTLGPNRPQTQRQRPMGRESGSGSPQAMSRSPRRPSPLTPVASQDTVPPPLPGESSPPPLPGEEDVPPLPREPALPAHSRPKAARKGGGGGSDSDNDGDYLHLVDEVSPPPLPGEEGVELPEEESHATYINTARAVQRGTPDGSSMKTKTGDAPPPPSSGSTPTGKPKAKPRAAKAKAAADSDFVPGDSDDDNGDAEKGYIYPDVGEYLPKSAFQDDMDRDKADSFLRALGKTGCYVIRNTSRGTTEARKVLSVWTSDRCRHYKIFYRKGFGFSLHGDKTFPDVQNLLAFYHGNNLPRCNHKLTGPYQGVIKR